MRCDMFFFQAEDGIRDYKVTGVQTCALPICFYHAVATRIARGAGYTWAWPDGVVTYAAHYPVGYPALLGAAYAVFGDRKSTRLNSSHLVISYAVFCLKKKHTTSTVTPANTVN